MTHVARANPSEVWASYDTFIFDADGVLWTGHEVVEGAPSVLNQLIEANKLVLILSNNSSITPEDHLIKCHKLGFTALTYKNLISSGMVAAHELLKLQHGETLDKNERSGLSESISPNLPVYLFGSVGLQTILKDAGIESFGPGADHIDDYAREGGLPTVDLTQKVSAVVASGDVHLSYIKVMKALNYLKDPDVHFIATNEDLTFPGPDPNIILPGAGCVSMMLRACSGREPIVMGKPHSASFNFIRERFHIEPKKTLMVGDRCDTDVWFGNRHGLDTLLVLSGIHQLVDVKGYEAAGKYELVPKFYTDSVRDLGKK